MNELAETRQPITDLTNWLDRQDSGVRPALRALGELLAGVAEGSASETADQFTARCLGVADCAQLVDEERDLNPIGRLTIPLALAEWIEEHEHDCEVGPGEHTHSPMWTQTEVGGRLYRHPMCLRVHFRTGALLDDAACVIHLETRETIMRSAQVSAYVTTDNQMAARAVLDRLAERGGELNPYRGQVVRAVHAGGLALVAIDLPVSATRDNVVVPDAVWDEIDLGVASVRDRYEVLRALGLGVRRGILLCGPPGTGKSAVSAVIATEVAGDFTVIYVEARAGAWLLTQVVEEAQRLGGPVLLVLEDVDLWCQDRSMGVSGLSELLQAMDIKVDARILTLASTNDASTLDKAAIRTGRFDSVVEVGYPSRGDAARIMATLLQGLPGAESVDVRAVAAALPEQTSGSDLREIVRRAVLTVGHTCVSTAALLAEVGSGRYQAELPTGVYL